MPGLLDDIIGTAVGTVGKVETYVEGQWTQRLVQISVYAGLMFYLLSTGSLISHVEKSITGLVGLKLGTEGTRAVHAVIFAAAMYLGTRFILDPLIQSIKGGVVNGVEGLKNKGATKKVAQKAPQKAPKRAPQKARSPTKPVQRKK